MLKIYDNVDDDDQMVNLLDLIDPEDEQMIQEAIHNLEDNPFKPLTYTV